MGKRRQGLGRRELLGLGAAALTAASAGTPPAYAVDKRFDLAGPNALWIDEKRLHHTTVMQSFAFDEQRHHIYAFQVMQGGIRLPGESRTYTHAERKVQGDLCLNRLSMNGDHVDHMYLKGFGHGGAIAVEERPVGSPRLWAEGDINPASGYGRAIVRFRYAAGTVLRSGSSSVAVFRPKPGTTNNNVALDLYRRRMLLRYRLAGAPRYALYRFDDFTAGRFNVLIDFPQPGAELGLPFQGMALHNGYAYQMLGHALDPDHPSSPAGDGRLHCIDVRTGRVVQEQLGRPARLRQAREPEGLAVLRRIAKPRLCLGFAAGPPRGRTYSIYYKQAL
ncbi:teichoic acid biosynthesis protein C [Streptomyces sporangiiformans]|uniref:Teichoic acid biosynthesis protein C n=1 Tax=Streptomyces sporangiiformans TaxID=2315329 RepID=A0A505DK50_9ACTN|nr:teichoic acid biosynthesis protein C [Streptomyces sporangiiformans]TPQ21638.1 teichoic acid biosynthesis protein C [Streptomyces sporangiiformans]